VNASVCWQLGLRCSHSSRKSQVWVELAGGRAAALMESSAPAEHPATATRDTTDNGTGPAQRALSVRFRSTASGGRQLVYAQTLTPSPSLAPSLPKESPFPPVRELLLHFQDDLEGNGASAAGDDGQTDCCPICLQGLDEDCAQLVCGHAYCLKCVLRWASHKGDNATCALCKQRIGAVLYCSVDLLGNRLDDMVEQPIVLLQRARWLGANDNAAGPDAECDDSPEEEEEDSYALEEDDELELVRDARVRRALLANRRLGSGGFVSNGRMYARVIAPPPPARAAGPSSAACSSKQQQSSKTPAPKSAQKEKREAKAAAAAQREAAKRERLRERVLTKPAPSHAPEAPVLE